MNIVHLLANDNYIVVNKDLIRLVGLTEAVIFGELASEYVYWEKQGGLDDEGYFYSTIDNIENNTGINEKHQREAIKNLENIGILKSKRKGLPAKRYIKINVEAVERMFKFVQNGGTIPAETAELQQSNKQVNNNKDKDKTYNKYIVEIVDFMNDVCGTKFRAQSQATRRHIIARLNEGYTVDDFKTVIRKKAKEWGLTDMAQYLRPETLFGSKFESYLNQPEVSRKESPQPTQANFEQRQYESAEFKSLSANINDLDPNNI